MFRNLTCAAAVLLAAACASDSSSPTGSPDQSAAARAAAIATVPTYGSTFATSPVGSIPTAVLHDAQRNRDVEMTIEYPTRGGPYPVIIFSHGYGGTKESYTPLTEYWTSRGYICIKPQHADAGRLREFLHKRAEERRAQLEKDRAAGKKPPRRNAQQTADANQPPQPDPLAEAMWSSQTPADWENRARDIAFIIDSLDAIEQKYPEIAGKMQKTNIGVGGHSYGAFTTMLLAGATSSSVTARLADPRIKAALAMSPQGTGSFGLTPESWRNVKIPTMFMTGSLDVGGPNNDPKWRHEAFQYSPAGDKYFFSFVGGRHMTFTGGVGELTEDDYPTMQTVYAPQTDAMGNPIYGGGTAQSVRGTSRGETQFLRDRRIFNNARVVSAAFWDTYLKNDTAARDYLKAGGTLDQSYSGGQVIVIERK
jgi:predicted dienelactone hydrolase